MHTHFLKKERAFASSLAILMKKLTRASNYLPAPPCLLASLTQINISAYANFLLPPRSGERGKQLSRPNRISQRAKLYFFLSFSLYVFTRACVCIVRLLPSTYYTRERASLVFERCEPELARKMTS